MSDASGDKSVMTKIGDAVEAATEKAQEAGASLVQKVEDAAAERQARGREGDCRGRKEGARGQGQGGAQGEGRAGRRGSGAAQGEAEGHEQGQGGSGEAEKTLGKAKRAVTRKAKAAKAER